MVDCHIHMVLSGNDWRGAIARHEIAPDTALIQETLSRYKALGYTYLRDGGDKWGVGAAARGMAPRYGITYRTPLAPLSKRGHYGGFIGRQFDSMREYAELVKAQKQAGSDFVKIMISGLMDFTRFGVLTQEGLTGNEIAEMIHIAHEEGQSVMAHANGGDVVEAAAKAGVDSVEHGAYLNESALAAMQEAGTVWVPTLSTIGNLLGTGRFPDDQVEKILESAIENVSAFSRMGGLLAPGTDAGAYAVPHGCMSEEAWLMKAGVTESALLPGIAAIMRKF